MNKITVLFPGGFKPLTGAHLALAQRYAEDPHVEQVILLIGPKERDGITRQKTIEMFDLLNSNPKIEIRPTEFNSPITAAYEYLFELPEDATGRYAMAASAKGDDYVRAKDFVPNVDKYATIGDKKGRLIPAGIDATELSINVDPLTYNNGFPISATIVRQSLEQNDYNTFRLSYPNNSDAEIKNVWQILKGVQEAALFSKEWWTKSLQEDVDNVLNSVKWWIIGDSIAAGTAGRSGGVGAKKSDDRGISQVGANPNIVLGFLKELGDKLKNQNICLSSGISNDTSGLNIVDRQLSYLKSLNCKVKLIGVSNEPPERLKKAFSGLNEKLKALAVSNGFTFLGGFKPGTDGVHPASYAKFQSALTEAIMNTSERRAHNKKITKLRNYLDNNHDDSFVYDFNKFPKTVYGAVLTEGGAAGHMAHPYDDHGLTFNEMREIVSRALEGRLDIEEAVTEKTDGQNIFVTWKNGEIGFARGSGTIINPMTTSQIIADFHRKQQKAIAEKGAEAGVNYQRVVDAYQSCAEDLTEAFRSIPENTLNQIFQNGRIFANMEIIFPATKNVIAYDKAHLQFHNLVEYDDTGKTVQTDLTGGAMMQKIIQDANAHMQKTFSFIPPQRIKLGQVYDFEDQQAAFFSEIDQLQNKFSLKPTDLVTEYHKAWWGDVIKTKAQSFGYEIPQNILDALIYRWAFNNKSTNISILKKEILNPEFVTWMSEFDKKDFKVYQKQNMEPFETIFLRLGVVVLKNAENFLAANPSKVVQEIKTELAELVKEIQASGNVANIKKLEFELKRIERIGGFDSIVPAEGLVFVYGGHTYKLTGSFAPINQLLGVLKYTR